jgi:hypothetical protein
MPTPAPFHHPPWDEYADRVAELYRPLTPADGLGEEALAAAEARLGLRLPRVLREFHRLAGAIDLPLTAGQPCHISLLQVLNDGVLLVGADEPLFDLPFRGVRPEDLATDDPPVVRLEAVTGGWVPEFERASDWLVTMLYWHAVHDGMPYAGAASVDETELPAIGRHWPRAERLGTLGDELLVFHGPGQVVAVSGRSPDLTLRAGGRTRDDARAITHHLRVVWDVDPLEEDEPGTV